MSFLAKRMRNIVKYKGKIDSYVTKLEKEILRVEKAVKLFKEHQSQSSQEAKMKYKCTKCGKIYDSVGEAVACCPNVERVPIPPAIVDRLLVLMNDIKDAPEWRFDGIHTNNDGDKVIRLNGHEYSPLYIKFTVDLVLSMAELYEKRFGLRGLVQYCEIEYEFRKTQYLRDPGRI